MRFQQRHHEGGFILLWSVVIALFLALLFAAAMLRGQSQLKLVNQREAQHWAFYAAEAGIDRAVFELRQSAEWRPGENGADPVDHEPLTADGRTIGAYSVRVADGGVLNGWDTLWLESVGEDALGQARRIVAAQVLIENPSRFLVSTLGDLRIGSGANIDADVLAKDIYFEVNNTLDSPDRDITASGDIFYIRSINGQSDPAVHVTGDVNHAPSITFAGVDLNRYRDLAEALSETGAAVAVEGDVTVDLAHLEALSSSGGSEPFRPQLIFATGDVRISGAYTHSLLVVAGKNVYVEGDIAPDADTDPRPQIGLFAKQDVVIPSGAVPSGGDLTLEAFVMADGEGASEGRFFAEGDKFSLGALDFTGAISVRGEGRTGVDLNAFSQRVYNFNPELNRRRAIPFTPFIVNVIRWQEAAPMDAFPPAD